MSGAHPIQVRVLDPRLGKEIPLPEYQTGGSAAMDLRAAPQQPLQLAPGACEMVPTGLAIYIRDPELAALIVPRSGLATREGIVLGNMVGLIDSDYQGPLMVPCWNRSDQPRTLQVGQRIAQLLLVPVRQGSWELVESFAPTARGEGGFGSTGKG